MTTNRFGCVVHFIAGIGFCVACYLSAHTAANYHGIPELQRSHTIVAVLHFAAAAANFLAAWLYYRGDA